MRCFRGLTTAVVLAGASQMRGFGDQGNRNFGAPRDRSYQGPPPPQQRQHQGGGMRGGAPGRPSEPQLVAKLLELFPIDKSWVPVGVWARDMPDEVREVLVAYGGLGNFASSQSNFFTVRTENDVKVVSLTTMGMSLCRERRRMDTQERKRAEKFDQRRNRGPPQRRHQQRIQ